MNILVKYPTRGRRDQFFDTVQRYISTATTDQWQFLVSTDTNDRWMSDVTTVTNGVVVHGESRNKVDAINRDIDQSEYPWDIVLVIPDDMWPTGDGWDAKIISAMEQYYPDLDGMLWFNDGRQDAICTIPVLGRKYYDRFGYIYHPDYASFFCDDEQTAVATALGRVAKIDECIIKHEHPAWGGSMPRDQLYIRNDRYWRQDKNLFIRRKLHNFYIAA